MMLDSDVLALLAARHADPFSVLGLHEDAEGGLWLSALLPGASAVTVLDAQSGKSVVSLEIRHPDGLFEAQIPHRRARFDYRLQVQWHDGQTGTYADAYNFGPQLEQQDLYELRDGRHLRPYRVLGAHALEQSGVGGVRFAVWAPNARRVSVVGAFNQWDGRRHPMRLRHDAGVWEIFVPHVAVGDLYKFELVGPDGAVLPVKADPYARATELRPGTASVVAPMPAPRALSAKRAQANRRDAPISIYELHPGSWRHGRGGRFVSWEELAQHLPDYVADLGFTHVELMPVSEHPFDGSWGYQTLGLYAPSARFGSVQGFEVFVQACHQRGLGVLLDWVPAHFQPIHTEWRNLTEQPCTNTPIHAKVFTATGTP